MARPPFDSVLDACLDEVRAGRQSVEQCLARWPQYAGALEPALRAALAVSALAVPEPPPDPARRAQFMAALRATPQQRPQPWRRPLGALAHALGGALQLGAVLAPAAAVAAAALVLVLGRGGSNAEASTLTVFAGNVERVEGSGWVALRDGDRLPEGTRLRTDAAGRVLLTFADGSTVAVDPQTEMTIERAHVNGAREIVLRQWSGRLWNQVAPDARANASFTVRTPDATVVVHGTVFETAITNGETAVTTAQGLVEVQTAKQRVVVPPGEAASARQDGVQPLARPRARTPAALTVSAPFVASLIGPDGRATGALPGGVLYQQIPGALSSDPAAGPQRIALGDVRSGEYALVLRRAGPGAGTLVVDAEGRERALPLDAAAETYTVRLRVTAATAQTVVAVEGGVQATGSERLAQPERIVVPERAVQAQQRAHDLQKQALERKQQAEQQELERQQQAELERQRLRQELERKQAETRLELERKQQREKEALERLRQQQKQQEAERLQEQRKKEQELQQERRNKEEQRQQEERKREQERERKATATPALRPLLTPTARPTEPPRAATTPSATPAGRR